MGKKGIEIIGVNQNELIGMLNEALCEEWLAFYQYWIADLLRMKEDLQKLRI